MSCPFTKPCHWAALIAACVLGAIAIQTFIALIAAAVAIGSGYTLWFAVVPIFSWSIFFLSLFLSLLMTAICFLKRCCQHNVSTHNKVGCCPASTDEHDAP